MSEKSKLPYVNDQNETNSKEIGNEYVFYKYASSSSSEATVAEQETSLSLMLTSLSKNIENHVREFLSKRVSKGSIFEGQGSISAVVIGGTEEEDECFDLLCYYCLIRQERDELDSLLSEPGQASNEFIVCLLSPNTVMLDLFRSDLDVFSRKIVNILEPDLLLELELREELGQLDGVDNRLQNYLSNWYQDSTRYLTRCLQILGKNVKFLLYCAISDIHLDVQCSDSKLKTDILRFIKCCSLSDLLSTMKSSDPHQSDSSCSESGAVLLNMRDDSPSTDVVAKSSLVIYNNGYRFHNCGCTEMCAEWGFILMNGEPNNPAFVKQVNENFKLKIIHDMNILKRMLKQAESDYYALFRCYNFLSTSGNEAVLIRHAQNEAIISGHRDSLDALAVIQDCSRAGHGVLAK